MVSKLPPSLTKVLARHPPEVIQSALICHWAAVQDVTAAQLDGSPRIAALLADATPAPAEISTALHAHLPHCTLKHVEQIVEVIHGRQKRQTHGTVYTPAAIIDYLVTHGLRLGWPAGSRLPKLCDPACGAGGFLLAAAERLSQQHDIPLAKIFGECLVGVDIDPWAVATTRLMIDLFLLQHGVSPAAVQVNVLAADTLLTPPAELLARAHARHGFDVVVTNPPYVKLQNLSPAYRAALAAAYPQVALGNFSLALLFLVRCHALLAAQGCAALITQNNLFTSLAGKGVRAYLQQTQSLRQIVDFGHHQVFDQASAYTCLIFLGRAPATHFAYGSLAYGGRGVEQLATLPLTSVATDTLDAKKWRLAPAHHLENLRRIEAAGTPLGELTNIRVGFATLKDTVFVLADHGDAADDDYCWATCAGQRYAIERAITRPAWRVPEFVGSGRAARPRRVIFPYHKVNGRYVPVGEEELAARYPCAYAYLRAHRAGLLARDKRRKRYAAWFAWGRTQGMDAAGPKLLTKTFSQRPAFVLDGTDNLFYNGYGIFPKATTPPLDVLARILNSRVMHYYARLTSFQIEGNYQCYQKNFIERFGIPALTLAAMDRLRRVTAREVDELLAASYGIDPAEMDEVVAG